MPLDDTALYLDAFGASATLAGAPLVAVVDTAAEIVLDDVITQAPAATVRTADAASAAAGQAFVADGITYSVRQVLRMPPDGAFQRLVLARS
jgi:hypothetical protein